MKTFLTTIKIFIFIIAVFSIQLDCVANKGNIHIEPQFKQPFMTGLDVLPVSYTHLTLPTNREV